MELVPMWLPVGVATGGLLILVSYSGVISTKVAILTWIAGSIGDCLFIAYEERKSNKLQERTHHSKKTTCKECGAVRSH